MVCVGSIGPKGGSKRWMRSDWFQMDLQTHLMLFADGLDVGKAPNYWFYFTYFQKGSEVPWKELRAIKSIHIKSRLERYVPSCQENGQTAIGEGKAWQQALPWPRAHLFLEIFFLCLRNQYSYNKNTKVSKEERWLRREWCPPRGSTVGWCSLWPQVGSGPVWGPSVL